MDKSKRGMNYDLHARHFNAQVIANCLSKLFVSVATKDHALMIFAEFSLVIDFIIVVIIIDAFFSFSIIARYDSNTQ